MPSILFLGATGYIGCKSSCIFIHPTRSRIHLSAAVFNAFINAHPAFEYTALVRTPSHSSHIRSVNTVIGTLENTELLIELTKKADVVVNVARADDLRMITAVIEGFKQRRNEQGKIAALIHTCGGDTFEGRDVWSVSRKLTQSFLHT